MEIKTQPSISFYGVDIVNMNFDSEQPFSIEEKVHSDIDAKILKGEDAGNFKILMNANVKSEGFFTLNIQALGNFKINNLENKEQASHLINVNAPAIMFPYVRAFITSLTANCGDAISTIVLPPQFFNGELEVLED